VVLEEILELRTRIDGLNRQLLDLLSERASLVEKIGQVKMRGGMEKFDPSREAEEVEAVLAQNQGPFSDAVIRHLFTEIFRASLDLMLKQEQRALKVSRKHKVDDTVFEIRGVVFGGPVPVMVAGPCSVESETQVRRVAAKLAELGVRVLRGGAVKPRSSPYAFQGLGAEGYRILRKVADEFNMVTISEVMDTQSLQWADDYVDILQIGTRNMSNFRLLEAARQVGKPVLLKRGFAATYEELLLAAEYLIVGTGRIILCERGIRTFEPWTRNTLDISAVPILQMQSHLPVMVDVSHAAGRTDILVPLARAALAAGANGVMVEVHPAPAFALSDQNQQLDLAGFEAFMGQVFGPRPAAGAGDAK
jgi:3-deoxy-7-phosphoheptulonate synthase/chorismate mutase